MCGILARASEDEAFPSAGWTCWNVSNSMRSAFRARRYSKGVELTSRMGGMERPRRR